MKGVSRFFSLQRYMPLNSNIACEGSCTCARRSRHNGPSDGRARAIWQAQETGSIKRKHSFYTRNEQCLLLSLLFVARVSIAFRVDLGPKKSVMFFCCVSLRRKIAFSAAALMSRLWPAENSLFASTIENLGSLQPPLAHHPFRNVKLVARRAVVGCVVEKNYSPLERCVNGRRKLLIPG